MFCKSTYAAEIDNPLASAGPLEQAGRSPGTHMRSRALFVEHPQAVLARCPVVRPARLDRVASPSCAATPYQRYLMKEQSPHLESFDDETALLE